MRFKAFTRKLRNFALLVHQSPGDIEALRNPLRIRAKYALASVFTAGFAALFTPVLLEQLGDWSRTSPEVAIAEDSWHVLYGPGPKVCPFDARKEPKCPANPKSPQLWNSPFKRTDPEHPKKIKASVGGVFWIGVSISPQLLNKAYRHHANQLVLGRVRALYRIWLDGEYLTDATADATEPLTLHLPMARLQENRPLEVAIEIHQVSTLAVPDPLNAGFGGEGFLTSRQANAQGTYVSFVTRVQPFSIFLADFLIACLFFLFWNVAQSKREYFYMALYAFSNALVQLNDVDLFYLRFSAPFAHSLAIAMRLYDGGLAMLLGFSFARLRPAFFYWSLPLILLLPLPLLAVDNQTILTVVISALYAAGAAACALQAHYLLSQKFNGTFLPIRIRRLRLLASGLVCLGILNFLLTSPQSALPLTNQVSWLRFTGLGLVFWLGAIVFTEQRSRELLIERNFVSEYHRRAELPAQVAGALLMADLKSSELFSRHRASQSESENLVAIWRSHFYTCILKYNGSVILKKGDEVIGFFDHDKCPNPALSALRAADEMAQLSNLLEQEFRARGMYPPDARGFHFRAAVSLGKIRPVWENLGGTREASWEEAGSSSPFVEAARLMEFERALCEQGESSLVVVLETLAMRLGPHRSELAGDFSHRAEMLQDKHGKIHCVAGYRSVGTHKAMQKRKFKAA